MPEDIFSYSDPIKMIYQCDDFIVINKPTGVSFHSEQDNTASGIVPMCEKQFGIEKLWPVHRLDKMTSGLLILARAATVAEQLNEKFRQRHIEKYYLAIASKKPKKKMGWVKGDLMPARRGSFKLMKTLKNPSITQFISQTISIGEIKQTSPSLRLFLLKPHTGRTHQLRVVMKSLASPICGDSRYQDSTLAKDFDRGYLHAYGLRFEWQGRMIELICNPDQGGLFIQLELHEQLAKWSTPWSCFK
ncbi:TIGR01621 family pseudouridine synthase [Thiomicrorhabdus sp. 6S2-11]|uniref:TIGR01621 family pseudouridine synthase n=1 Tax=Thiomicrorhabdus marina TaxID=2818442 RepID=A0ABS3Q3L9_9GAMM|nr:TIGR01621 family pseudouridine synthase [Thiomicrorhabdus marina]MBO1926733.1 TIGR01621 family pseudouridine synthase [Thiomicrorhabdus marina]